MPDLTLETRVVCCQNTFWSRPVKGEHGEYIVSYGRVHKGAYEYDYSCECLAFKYQPGYCKHIKQVMGERCKWGASLDQYKHVDTCPKCHGPTEVVRIAV